MIRDNQIKGLADASKHNLYAGLLVNYRNDANDTFFIEINQFLSMLNNINKKSFNIKDLENAGAIKLSSKKKRTRYTYDIKSFLEAITHD